MSRLQAFLHKEAQRGTVTRAKPGTAPSWSMLRNMPRPRVPVHVQALLDETRADRMTVRYFDSSAFLSGLLDEKDLPALHELWNGADERLSSSLLKIECVIAARRAARLRGLAPDDKWAHDILALLSGFLDALSFKSIDGSIEEIIRLTAERDASEEIDGAVTALADEIPAEKLSDLDDAKYRFLKDKYLHE